MTEKNYLETMKTILEQDYIVEDRTGVGTKTIFGNMLQFDLNKGFPLLTTRFIAFRIAFEEMMFFLQGKTNTKELEAKKINIWKGNTTREFLDARGLYYLPEGEMGRGYGHQIRNFGGTENQTGFDQLEYLVNNIKTNPTSRRHYMNYWNPDQVLNQAALPPCHLAYNCQVNGQNLNAAFYMRSSDWYHGAPYNIAGYAFLTILLAKLTGYNPGKLVMMTGDTHLYQSQFEVAEEQIKKDPLPFPELKFHKEINSDTSLSEALSLEFTDLEVVNYQHQGKLRKVEMAV